MKIKIKQRIYNYLNSLKPILLSWDIIVSLLITVIFSFILDSTVSSEFAKDIYGVGISVLSIIFSVYFAALALIITSGDDDFVHFLEQEGDYTGIINNFKFSLLVLFFALIYSILIYTITSAQIFQQKLSETSNSQPEFFLWIFAFLFSYGLFAAFSATQDSITYALFRTRFLAIKKKNKPNQESDQN